MERSTQPLEGGGCSVHLLMNTAPFSSPTLTGVGRFRIPLAATLAWALLLTTWAEAVRTQQIPLRAGWNAVFLEVQPAETRPDRAFEGLPVETVACFYPGSQEAGLLRPPGGASWREEGWAVWYAPSRPEAFAANLFTIQSQRAYLILATADALWTVTGRPRAQRLNWHPDSCTFTGLPVDPAAPPTFGEFFRGSSAHERLRIFQLQAGQWKRVANPAATLIRSGEAYWIQSDGPSTWPGPLAVNLPATGELDFDVHSPGQNLDFENLSSTPAQIQIETVLGTESLPLRQPLRLAGSTLTERNLLPARVSLPELAAGGRATLRLEPARDALSTETAETLLRLTDGRGTQLWLPIRARRAVSTALVP